MVLPTMLASNDKGKYQQNAGKVLVNFNFWMKCTSSPDFGKKGKGYTDLVSFPDLPWLQFLITCSMQTWRGKVWEL